MSDARMPILVVDDEAAMRHMLRLVLEKAGYEVTEAENGLQAIEVVERSFFPLVLCDIRMPEMDGLELLPRLLQSQPGVTIIMMSAYGSIERAIECMKLGAYDYISKPFQPDEVVLALKKAEERRGLVRENRELRQQTGQSAAAGQDIVAQSQAMKQIYATVGKVAESPLPVLITGETGTGKEVVARAVHEQSKRASGDWVAVNCGAISPQLMESELFGHVRGAFTGADRNRDGLFVMAHGGTLFLDEIGELPLELQPKLLRVLQEREVRRVGEAKPRKVDVRILAATSRDLREEVQQGRFREDLFYRLNAVEIHLPPLRERQEDIPLLVEKFARQYANRVGQVLPVFSAEVLHALQQQPWLGNARELQNTVEKLVLFSHGPKIEQLEAFGVANGNSAVEVDCSLKKATEKLEKEYIQRALERTAGNRTRAAEILEISLRSLQYKIKEYGL